MIENISENVEKKEAAKPAKKKREVATKQRRQEHIEATIYVGPSLKGGRLARYTIFKNGILPRDIAKIAEEHKAINRLIIPVSKLAEFEARLRDKSGVEAALYAEAGKIFSKGDE